MVKQTSIEWTDTTWNPVTGCTKVSPGCAHCYAETFAERFRGVPGHPFEQGFDLKLWPERLSLPLGWKKPRRIFVNSMSDLFHEDVSRMFIADVYGVMVASYWHTFQVLTKRPERRRELLNDEAFRIEVGNIAAAHINRLQGLDPLETGRSKSLEATFNLAAWNAGTVENIWEGTSTENQHWLDIRVPELLATPAAVRFLSCEPLLGPLDLNGIDTDVDDPGFSALSSVDCEGTLGDAVVDWVIVGGESGPKARSMDVGWARSIVKQCRAAGVACFVKQLGAKPYLDLYRDASGAEFPTGEPVPIRLKSRKGGDMAEWPEDLRVREMPV